MDETNQKEIFLGSEGDRFYERNRAKLEALDETAEKDQVLASLRRLDLSPSSVLEIGCSNGWRLEAIRRTWNPRCSGIEPSPLAIERGQEIFPDLDLRVGTANELPFSNDLFDLVILGFCLYLCDRKDLFRIASEADRVLRNEAHLAILDFHPPFAYRNSYAHRSGIYAYKMDYSKMFSWNPAYTVISVDIFNETDRKMPIDDPDQRLSVTILRKNSETAYATNPWAKT